MRLLERLKGATASDCFRVLRRQVVSGVVSCSTFPEPLLPRPLHRQVTCVQPVEAVFKRAPQERAHSYLLRSQHEVPSQRARAAHLPFTRV